MIVMFLQNHWVFFGSMGLLVLGGLLFSYAIYRSAALADQRNENQKIQK